MQSERNVATLLGDPKRAIRAMALPLVASLLVAQVNNLADRAWCAGLGNDSLAAIAVVSPIYMVMMGLGNGLGVGASATVSRYIGADDKEKADSCARQIIVFSLLFGLAVTVPMVLSAGTILSVIGSEDINGLAKVYMTNLMLFSSVLIANGVVSGLLRGEGAARTATVMILISAILNVALDPVLIYILGMGIGGAAYATVISVAVSTLFGLYQFAAGRTFTDLSMKGFRPDRERLLDVLRLGVPQMLEYTVMYAMNIALNFWVIYCGGSEGLTIYSVPNVVMDLTIIPAMAVGSALVPVASSAFGQRDMRRMEESYRYSLKVAILSVVCICAVIMLFPKPFLYIFTYSPETAALRDEMAVALRIYCLYIPPFAFVPMGSSLLQALMMPNRSVVLAIVRNLVLILFFGIAAQFDLYWIFWAIVAGEIIGGAMMYTVADRSFKKVCRGMAPAGISV